MSAIHASSSLEHLEQGAALSNLVAERKRKRIAVVLTVYGDESHDEKTQRTFAVAGLIGSQDQWDRLEILWTKRLGGRIFHAADCETDQGDFERSAHEDNQKLYADLTNLVAKSGLVGFGSSMHIAGFSEFFPDALPDTPYYKCFGDVIRCLSDFAYTSVPQERLKFTFDQRAESKHNASLLYDYFSKLPENEWPCSHLLFEEIGFASRKLPGIQVADLWARESMKHLDNALGPKIRPPRKSFEVLVETGRFGCDRYMKEYFEDLERKMEILSAQIGVESEKMLQWLEERRLQDNYAHRLRYLIEVKNFC